MVSETIDTKKELSVFRRAKSLAHASRGVWLFVRTTPNAWIEIGGILVIITLGFFFAIKQFEWIVLVLVFGLVLVAEAFNTAIEIDVNLTSPEYHPYARDTKDVAAGAVLISVWLVLIVSLLVFWPYFIK